MLPPASGSMPTSTRTRFAVDHPVRLVCARAADGFPLCYNSHPLKQFTVGIVQDPTYARAFPQLAPVAGPLPVNLLNKMFNDVIVDNVGVQLRGVR